VVNKDYRKAKKIAEKSRPHWVDPYGSNREDYKVIHHGETLPNGDFKNFKYIVHIKEGMMSKCMCLKSKLTGIPCSHILAVIRVRKFELNRFICPFYSAQTLLNIWSGYFYPEVYLYFNLQLTVRKCCPFRHCKSN
jgi:SWIM zinc finger